MEFAWEKDINYNCRFCHMYISFKRAYLRASSDGVLDKTAFLQAGSASCDMTRFVS